MVVLVPADKSRRLGPHRTLDAYCRAFSLSYMSAVASDDRWWTRCCTQHNTHLATSVHKEAQLLVSGFPELRFKYTDAWRVIATVHTRLIMYHFIAENN